MRVLRIPLGGLLLIGLAAAFAVLVFGQGSATPAAAQPLDPHYKCYSILQQPPLNETVSLQTQFGVEQNVVVGPPSALCLPAGKNGAQIPQGAPLLKCYLVAAPPTQNPTVNLTTQFGGERKVEVGPAQELCVPAGEAIAPQPAPPPLPTPDYKCYAISGTAPSVPPVSLLTQFGTEQSVPVGTPATLCMPAGMNQQPVPAGVVPLKCYNIADPPPGVTVDLQTVFGVENGLVLGPAVRLCAPALLESVGGVADLAPGAGASEEAGASAGGSGWSAGAYAALAGGLAAAAIVVAGGGWYARRRWLR